MTRQARAPAALQEAEKVQDERQGAARELPAPAGATPRAAAPGGAGSAQAAALAAPGATPGATPGGPRRRGRPPKSRAAEEAPGANGAIGANGSRGETDADGAARGAPRQRRA